jgi:1,4-alpha-glucan branching enzyme
METQYNNKFTISPKPRRQRSPESFFNGDGHAMPIDPATAPMGANLLENSATFRCWAPQAHQVDVCIDLNGSSETHTMVPDSHGYWFAEIPGIKEGTKYNFHVVGDGSEGDKRDPYARALTLVPKFPNCNCLVTAPKTFVWHDANFSPPAFSDLIIYQFHFGVYVAEDATGNDQRANRPGTFLDVLFRLDYLAELGINAIEPLPIDEFPTETSLGYNGTDYFSPEMDYIVPPDVPGFSRYVDKANALLTNKGIRGTYTAQDLEGQTKQLMALIDLCHVYGIAVIFDVVYNHAGGGFDDESLYFFDREVTGDNNRSQYFTDQGWAGGLVFAYWKQDVCQFLINNAKFFCDEYHVDGFRFDEVTVIDRFGGWQFCQNLTDTLHSLKPQAPLIAEYWMPDQSYVVRRTNEGGAGFDCAWSSGLRQAVRGALSQATSGRWGFVNLDPVRDNLYPPLSAAWRAVVHLENHDVVRVDNQTDRQPRIAALADPSDHRSWYARSRTRVAMGLQMTAPGVPMLFMGQEFLEDKYWSDNPQSNPGTFIWWDGLRTDKAMQDYLRFTRELIGLRRSQPALRGQGVNVFHVHNDNRVLAFQRWVEGAGRDVVVVVSLNESTFWNYRLGFPNSGRWLEVFNSDVYDNWVNPWRAGNGGSITTEPIAMHGFPNSAQVVIPANAFVVFARG